MDFDSGNMKAVLWILYLENTADSDSGGTVVCRVFILSP